MLTRVDAFLRDEGVFSHERPRVPWAALVALTCVGGFTYGAVMGSYSLHPLQAFYSGLKVPLLLAVSSAICLPSFFVVNTLLGLRDEFSAALRGVLAAQAALAITLASLAPITVVFYASTAHYQTATLFNGFQFAVATVAGQFTLARHYRPLIQTNPRHRWGKRAWVTLYIFVAIQMAWVLRPFIGSPLLETRLFREEAWSNAYVRLFQTVITVLEEVR